jgi:hypothetical protein
MLGSSHRRSNITRDEVVEIIGRLGDLTGAIVKSPAGR